MREMSGDAGEVCGGSEVDSSSCKASPPCSEAFFRVGGGGQAAEVLTPPSRATLCRTHPPSSSTPTCDSLLIGHSTFDGSPATVALEKGPAFFAGFRSTGRSGRSQLARPVLACLASGYRSGPSSETLQAGHARQVSKCSALSSTRHVGRAKRCVHPFKDRQTALEAPGKDAGGSAGKDHIWIPCMDDISGPAHARRTTVTWRSLQAGDGRRRGIRGSLGRAEHALRRVILVDASRTPSTFCIRLTPRHVHRSSHSAGPVDVAWQSGADGEVVARGDRQRGRTGRPQEGV